MKKAMLYPKRTKSSALILFTALGLICSVPAPVYPPAQAAETKTYSKSSPIFDHYLSLLERPAQLPSAIQYLNAHIDEVTADKATLMVLYLENAIKKALPAMENRFFSTSIQSKINSVYKYGDSLAQVRNRTNDKTLISLMNAASASGFKLETAEGTYFPVVNYSIFKRYRPYIHADIQAYIDIMAEETRKAVAKDAALVIGYQELVHRAMSQERFLNQFPWSNRSAAIRHLFRDYKFYTFYGLSNTPLIDYENHEMQPNAKLAYSSILKWNETGSSEYLTTLKKFMDLLAEHNYTYSQEVKEFLEKNVPVD